MKQRAICIISALVMTIIIAGCLDSGLTKFGNESKKIKRADNKSCYICHKNHKKESLAVRHAKSGVGCASCHGKSHDHCEDKKHLTPPDNMFPKKTINKSCMKCHAEKKLRSKESHNDLFAKPDKNVCTDCHGSDHRLKKRQVQWDKVTRKLKPKNREK